MNDYEVLLAEAKSLSTDNAKVYLLFRYILDKVDYNYAGDIKALLFENMDEMLDDFEAFEIDDNHSYEQRIDDFIEIEARRMTTGLFEDEELEDREINRIVSALELVPKEGNPMEVLAAASSRINHPIYNNGMLLRGNSSDIIDFMQVYLNDNNIKCLRMSGNTSGFKHEWLMFFDGAIPYHIDPTSALFLRDKTFGLNGRQVDYARMSNTDLFSMDSNRIIEKVGGRILTEPITKDNYSQPYDEDKIDFYKTAPSNRVNMNKHV